MPDAPLLKLEDGELRGNGAIVVLPPSLHESGANYQWLNPPRAQLTVVSPSQLDAYSDARLYTCRVQADPEQIQADPSRPQANPSMTCVELHASIEHVIVKTLPSGPGQRNACLFKLARELRAFLPRETPKSTLKSIVKNWHRRALPFIRTKGLVETIADFAHAWETVRWPTGTLWDRLSSEAANDPYTLGDGDSELDATARIMRALARYHRGEPFPLSARKLGRAIGVDAKTALARLDVLTFLGLVELVEKGEPRPGGKASVWRWVDPLS
jgi:hypothetical protein